MDCATCKSQVLGVMIVTNHHNDNNKLQLFFLGMAEDPGSKQCLWLVGTHHMAQIQEDHG